jgi:hypothetical protein
VQDEFPEFENAVTVNTLIGDGDTVKVYLAYTDELNGNPLEIIENAVIYMSNQNLESISFIHQGNGLYVSNYVAQIDDSFNLTVLVPNEDVVTSSCVVPEPIEIIDADVDSYGWVSDEGVASPLAYIKIKNDVNKAFYGVVYIRIYSKEPHYNLNLDNPDDPYFIDTIYRMVGGYNAIGTISNISESGEFLEKEFGFIKSFYYSNTIAFAYQFKLRTVDYNYYTYHNSISAFEVSRYTDFSNSYVVPSNLFSNIENGYGIMGAFSEFETDTIFK